MYVYNDSLSYDWINVSSNWGFVFISCIFKTMCIPLLTNSLMQDALLSVNKSGVNNINLFIDV